MMVEFRQRQTPSVPGAHREASGGVQESPAAKKQAKLEELRRHDDTELSTWLDYWEELHGTMGTPDAMSVKRALDGINGCLQRLEKTAVTEEELPKGAE